MPSRNLDHLKCGMKSKAGSLLEDLKSRGIIMVPYCTLRTDVEQARLWRASRTTQQVRDAILLLNAREAPRLAVLLVNVGPIPMVRRHLTWALPGQSHHHYGDAVDCYRLSVDGGANWGSQAYRSYAKAAEEHGLKSLGRGIGDWPHVQDEDARIPKDWEEIEANMLLAQESFIEAGLPYMGRDGHING